MFLNFIWMFGLIILISQKTSLMSVFFSLEVIFFLIMSAGIWGTSLMYIWSLVLVVGSAIFGLTLVVSTTNFFGSDSQFCFLD